MLKLVHSRVISSLYKKHGNNSYIGEKMSQMEHALQTANYLRENNYGPVLEQAGLLHDIGHILALEFPYMNRMEVNGVNYGAMNHEKIGADFLRNLNVDEDVCKIVENHVRAKKYLISSNFRYFKGLSEASKTTATLVL